MGIRQRKQQEEIGFSSPYPFLRPFFATGTKRTSEQEGTNSATMVSHFMLITRSLELCWEAVSKGTVSVTSSPLRLAHSGENYIEYGFVFLLLLPSYCLFSSFSSAASFSFPCFLSWLHHAQNCSEGPAGGAGSGNVWHSAMLVWVSQVWPEAGEIMFCLDCPAGETASKRKVLSTDSLFFALFCCTLHSCFVKTYLPALCCLRRTQNWIPTISHSSQLTFFLPWKRHK